MPDQIPLRPLGRTGVKVSALGLGGHHLGDVATVDEAVELVHEAIDAGITFFDNCWEYYDGRSEDWLGRGLKGKRDKVFLMTKVCTHGRSAALGSEDARGVAAPAADRSSRPLADPRHGLRQRSRVGLRQGRRPRGARQGEAAGQDALRRLHRPQEPGGPPEDAPAGLPVRHGPDAAQSLRRHVHSQLRAAGLARGQQARHGGARHEELRGDGHVHQARRRQARGAAALRDESAGRRHDQRHGFARRCCGRT